MRPRAKPDANVYLIGFMASGKSAVGRALASRLGRRLIDTDRDVERIAKRKIARIFTERGEEAFRRLESRAIARAARRRGAVIALGGGAVLHRANVNLIRRTGSVAYLQVPLSVLRARGRRASRGSRPLWKRNLRTLLSVRRPAYRRAAHIVVRASQGSPRAVAGRIVRALEIEE